MFRLVLKIVYIPHSTYYYRKYCRVDEKKVSEASCTRLLHQRGQRKRARDAVENRDTTGRILLKP